MYVETWSDFRTVLYSVLPLASGVERTNCGECIDWSINQRSNYFDINQDEINWVINWIDSIKRWFTGQARTDLNSCTNFLSRLNKIQPPSFYNNPHICLHAGYYWYNNACHETPSPLPPPPPPPPPDNGVFTALEYSTDVLMWFNDQTGLTIAADIDRNWSKWYNTLGGFYEYSTVIAALDSMSFHINMVLAQVSINFELIETWIGDIRRLDGDSIVDAIRHLQAGVGTEAGKQTEALYNFLDMRYNKEFDSISRITGGIMDDLMTMICQWEDQGEKLGGVAKSDIEKILTDDYKLMTDTITTILNRLDNIEREVGIVTEEVIIDIEEPVFEAGEGFDYIVPASIGWVKNELKRLANATFKAMDVIIDEFAKPINFLLHHVFDISDPWLAALKEKLGDVGGEYDLEADTLYQELRSEVNVIIDDIYGLPDEWVSVLANRLKGWFDIGIGGKGEKGDPGAPGAQGIQGIQGVQGEPGEPGEGVGMAIEDIDSQLKERLVVGAAIVTDNLTGVIDYNIGKIGEIFSRFDLEVKPITEFLTTDMQDTLTMIAESFETPEALIAFLLDVPEGQEGITFDLMQLLITQIMERGLE